MLNYNDWVYDPYAGHIKTCIEHGRFDILLICSRNPNDEYDWSPQFLDEQMWKFYIKYNPKKYTYIIDADLAKHSIDHFIEKYNKLLVFM